ncbi:MAG: hypothetical protein HY264_01245 [Chloroflexi bacterium]|nr:hypothetical protein [Chloroflexota bacterium]
MSAASGSSVLVAPTVRSRLLGLGSVFGKAFRDSRRTAVIIGALFGALAVATASQVATEFPTAAGRLLFAAQLTALPALFQGMLGEPIHIETLGGFVSWRIFNFVPVMLGIWSLVALSGTLAGELARGSLDPVASTPVARRRLAIEKVGAFLAALALAVAILEVATWAGVNALAQLPGDGVSGPAVAAQGAWVFLTVLAPGALAFAVAPVLGRSGSLAVGATVLFLSFVVQAYANIVPAFESLKPFSYLQLTAGHRPLAGRWDWPAMELLAVIVLGLLVAGVAVFERRDLLAPSPGRFRVPPLRLWVRGPFLRGLGERFPAALIWGAGLGLYALLIATSADEFVTQIAKIPQMTQMIRLVYPGADILSTGGFLQLAFFQQGIVMIGLTAAVFVGGWASDENDRRLEVLLAAPVSRIAWTLRSGSAVFVAIGLTTLLMAAGVAVGTAAQGGPIDRPVFGVAMVGLYGLALAGIGLAVGGLVRPSLAAPVTGILTLVFSIADLLGGILRLPDAVMSLDLNRHLGTPMLGRFDESGIVLFVVLAVGGLALGAAGIRRRDIGR